MKSPLSLSMLKMEKNFIAVIEKKYQRKPYETYPLFGGMQNSLLGFVLREYRELEKEMGTLHNYKTDRDMHDSKDIQDQIIEVLWEIADVSNTLDYLFEALIKEHKKYEVY